MMRHTTVVLVVLAAIALSVPMFGQSATGTVDGTLKDPSGAAVPNATVVLTNTATGLQRSITSDSSGYFNLSSVAAGTYRVAAQAQGFKKSTADFKLDVAGLQTLNIVLAVGDVSESVMVTDAVRLVNTQEGEISHVVQET